MPPDRFGVVAAVARNHVIGVGGSLPWHIPEDTKNFEALTRGKVLIIGRSTLEEVDDISHISHTRKCIVVSKTAKSSDYDPIRITVARSFPEALGLARALEPERDADGPLLGLDCWVGGGQAIFDEALQHRSAEELHLTKVEADIVPESFSFSRGENSRMALFPAKHWWDHNFQEFRRWKGKESETQSSSGLSYVFYVYKRIR